MCGVRLLNPPETMTPELIGACLENNYVGHAGVGRQVICEWNTHARTHSHKEREETPFCWRSFSLLQEEASPNTRSLTKT